MEEANGKIQEIDAGGELWEASAYEGREESTQKERGKCGGILFFSIVNTYLTRQTNGRKQQQKSEHDLINI